MRSAIAIALALAAGSVLSTASALVSAEAQPACTSWAPILVLDAQTAAGIDPAAGTYVTDQVKRTAAAAGYLPIPAGAEAPDPAHPQAEGQASPPSPSDVLRLTQARHAERGVFASVSASGGAYVVYLFVASADQTGPFTAQGTAASADLAPMVDGLLRSILPPPIDAGCAVTQPVPGASLAQPTSLHATAPSATSDSAAPAHPWRLALATESAFGLTDNFFYNHLLGVRLDRRFSSRVAFGPYLGYANLKGPDGRASNWLAAAQLEYQVGLWNTDAVTLPLRFGAGYLPKNGPTLRLSAGVSFALSNTVNVAVDLLAPMFWVTHNQTIVSLDVAAELGVAL